MILQEGWKGVDVSGWQRHRLPWTKLPLRFAVVKATEGERHRSEGWRLHARDVKRAGMALGAYHFAHLDGDPVRQARLFVRVLRAGPWPDFAALDVEWSRRHDSKGPASKRVAWIKAWIAEVEGATKLPVAIYTQASYWRWKLGKADLSKWPLWQAGRWRIKGWPATMVQRKGRLPGVRGKIDINTVKRGWA